MYTVPGKEASFLQKNTKKQCQVPRAENNEGVNAANAATHKKWPKWYCWPQWVAAFGYYTIGVNVKGDTKLSKGTTSGSGRFGESCPLREM